MRAVNAVLFILFIGICSGEDIVVKLNEGQIRGRTAQSSNLKTYYAFEGIPYAAAPIGQLRFKPPQAHKGWTGILNTTKSQKICHQFTDSKLNPTNNLLQTEDCLLLNVYSPVAPGTQNKLPVLFWIHGGGFLFGYGSLYGPKRFMDYGIVVVTINYRLGSFGFLTTNNADIPGNNGLKDQLMALQWVQKNIGLFGGNPAQVTIDGESAGAASVSYQILNRNAQNLFRAAIMQSGSALNTWAYQSQPESLAFSVGRVINSGLNNNSSELLTVLRNAPAASIITASKEVALLSMPWLPIVENANVAGAIITTPMHEAFMAGNFHKVPILTGYNSEEVLTFLLGTVSLRVLADTYDVNPGLIINGNLNIANKLAAGIEIKELYTSSFFGTDLASFVRALSDLSFISGISRQAEISAKLVPTYIYQFSYSGSAHKMVNVANLIIPEAERVGHAEELYYLWDMGMPLNSAGDKLASTHLLTLFTNFVKTLNPTPTTDANLNHITWHLASQSNLEFLNINTTLSMRSQPRNYQRVKKIYAKYVRPPLAVF